MFMVSSPFQWHVTISNKIWGVTNKFTAPPPLHPFQTTCIYAVSCNGCNGLQVMYTQLNILGQIDVAWLTPGRRLAHTWGVCRVAPLSRRPEGPPYCIWSNYAILITLLTSACLSLRAFSIKRLKATSKSIFFKVTKIINELNKRINFFPIKFKNILFLSSYICIAKLRKKSQPPLSQNPL